MADTQDYRRTGLRLNWRRVGIVAAVLVGILTWSRPMLEPLIRGWFNSCQVLDRRAEIEALRQQREHLAGKLAYVQTEEGKDVEAKRQFGVGPPEEVRIVVRPRGDASDDAIPKSLGERLTVGMNRVGGAWVGAVRRVRDVVKYWSGLDPAAPAGDLPSVAEPLDEAAAR